jgi:alpha-mannosidase
VWLLASSLARADEVGKNSFPKVTREVWSLWKITPITGSMYPAVLTPTKLTYSAWDVDQFHLEKQTHLKFGQVRIVEEGPLRATLGTTVQLGQSKMDIEISLDAIPASLKVDARSLIRFHAVM